VSVVSGGLTIFVILWVNKLGVDYDKVPGRKHIVESKLPKLGYLVKCKTGIGCFNIFLVLAYILLYAMFHSSWLSVSPWAFARLELVYGKNTEALLPPIVKRM
jgi:hypothetical protein